MKQGTLTPQELLNAFEWFEPVIEPIAGTYPSFDAAKQAILQQVEAHIETLSPSGNHPLFAVANLLSWRVLQINIDSCQEWRILSAQECAEDGLNLPFTQLDYESQDEDMVAICELEMETREQAIAKQATYSPVAN